MGFNAVGVTFPNDLDEWGLLERAALPLDSVEIYHHDFGYTTIFRAAFYTILLAFAERLVARPGQAVEWYTAMHTALDKLRAKMADDAAAAQ
ncbi:hypothetical protein [Hymenobacter negativus]|uniref:Uncharacterized protein n=1 Tax=Hymenobacter negativus TaxID=2795026 RepID=A0ABS3QIJ3_9BACT|nr:hypothetical protein [Hymenobacter negativus]MBO2011056.1 hypothetical protein [Hymenobacter negativus]